MSYANNYKKYSTYAELRNLMRDELDLYQEDPAEQFITTNEMIGYYNDAILDARSEILAIYEDYFLTWNYLALVTGQDEIKLPLDIWADKIRGITYEDGSIRFTIPRVKNYNKLEKIIWGEYPPNATNAPNYVYYTKDSTPGEERLVFMPAAQITTTDQLLPNPYTPVKCWYLRQCNRIPRLAEYAYPKRYYGPSVFTGSNVVTIASDLWAQCQTGQGIKFSADSATYIPAELSLETAYYMIKQATTGQVKLATSKANALAGTVITISAPAANNVVSVLLEANQNLIDNTVVDLPEFSNFVQAWVRVRVLGKQRDATGLDIAKDLLEQARKQLNDSLSNKIPDDDDLLEGDFSHYSDSSSWLPGSGSNFQ